VAKKAGPGPGAVFWPYGIFLEKIVRCIEVVHLQSDSHDPRTTVSRKVTRGSTTDRLEKDDAPAIPFAPRVVLFTDRTGRNPNARTSSTPLTLFQEPVDFHFVLALKYPRPFTTSAITNRVAIAARSRLLFCSEV